MQCLAKCRKEIASALGLEEASLELSMGMSGDYERAVRDSACVVRSVLLLLLLLLLLLPEACMNQLQCAGGDGQHQHQGGLHHLWRS